MSSDIDLPNKLPIRYDKINTKYNRLWEQLTNMVLFIFAALIVDTVLYVEYSLNNLPASIFLSKATLPTMLLLLPVILLTTSIFTLLVTTRSELNKFLKDYKIFN